MLNWTILCASIPQIVHGFFQLNLASLVAHGHPGQFSHVSHHHSEGSTAYSITLCYKKVQYINCTSKTSDSYYNFNIVVFFCYIFHNKTNSTFTD